MDYYFKGAHPLKCATLSQVKAQMGPMTNEALSELEAFLSKNKSISRLVVHLYYLIGDLKKVRSFSNLNSAIRRFLLTFYSPHKVLFILRFLLDSIVGLTAQSGMEYFGCFIDNWESLRDSEFVNSCQKVIYGCLTAGLVQIYGYDFDGEAFKNFFGSAKFRPFSSTEEMWFSIMKLIRDFTHIGHECFAERSIQPLLVRNREVRIWMEDYNNITKKLDELPVSQSFDPMLIIKQIDKLLAQGNLLLSRRYVSIGMLVKELTTRRTHFIKENNVCSYRSPPFSLLLYGKPGIGKSTMISMIGDYFHKAMTTPLSDGTILEPDLEWNYRDNVYTRTPDEEYWSGFKGAKQWCIVLDDLARERKSQIAQGKTVSIKEIITVVNSIGIATNQASIEDKGCIPLLPKLVIATTNIKDLHAYSAVSEPGAVLRRFPFVVEPIVKPEFLDNDGNVELHGEANFDIWDFKVEKVVRKHNVYEYELIRSPTDKETFTGIEFSFFLRKKMQEFVIKQKKLESSFIDKTEECEHGVVITYHKCPDCMEAQSLTRESIYSFWIYFTTWFVDRLFGNIFLAFIMRDSFMGNHISSWCRSKAFASIRRRLIHNKIEFLHQQSYYMLSRRARELNSVLAVLIGIFSIYGISSLVAWIKGPSDHVFAQSDIWEKNESNEDFVIPRKSCPGNMQEIRQTVRKSMFILNITNHDKVERVYCLCIRPGIYITVGHVFGEGNSWNCVADFMNPVQQAKAVRGFVLERDQLQFLPNDLCIISTRHLIPRKPLYDFLPEKIDKAGRVAQQILYENGALHVVDLQTHNYGTSSYRDRHGNVYNGNFMHGRRFDGFPKAGDCGSPLIHTSKFGCYIAGIHVAGHSATGNVVFSQLSKEIFKDTIPQALSGPGNMNSIMTGSRSSGELTEPYRKGIHHWTKSTSCEILGSYKGRHTPVSKVCYSKICTKVRDAFDYPCPYGKPVMTPFQSPSGEWINPFTLACNEQASISPYFKESTIRVCRDQYLKHVGPVELDYVVLPQEAAINGMAGVDFINRLPMKTSGGFFFPGSKKRYFEEEEDGILYANEEVQERIDEIEQSYVLGERANILFQGTLKDEPTKFKKIAAGKTRVFTACDVAFSIIVRKQYLGVTKFIMEHNLRTECAVGMNCYSEQWGDLYDYLTCFGEDRIIAGDYSAFDKNMPSILILEAFSVLNHWLDLVDPCPRNRAIRQGIATDIAFPIVNLNGDVFQFYGGNSSGHPLTVIINSIVNSLYMRYAYIELGLEIDQFSQNVRLMTLGDDNIIGSKCDSFNHTAVARVLGDLGVPYTMADKQAESVPFIHIGDSDFLKRKFIFRSGRIRAPLAVDSIFKSLCVNLPKGNISEEEQIAQCCLAASMEMVLHGREQYFTFQRKLMKILEDEETIQPFLHPRVKYSYDQWISWFDGEESLQEFIADSSEEE